MLNAAHASAFHWGKVGTELPQARAEMLLGHVYSALRVGQTAEVFAQRSCDYLTASESPDWELAFAHANLAHAAFAAGEEALHQEHDAKA